MDRRRFLLTSLAGTLAAPLAAWPRFARAQQQAKSARLGFVGFGDPADWPRVEVLRAGLRDLGHVEGKNLVIEFRWSRTVEQMREAAAELARMKVDVIFAATSTEAESARRATSTTCSSRPTRRATGARTSSRSASPTPSSAARRGS
jgi:putative ABC transport system substrate-binding protein